MKKRVMIIEDSKVTTELLKYIINGDPRLKVVSTVESGEEALKQIEYINPDVISMDIRLPGINGLETTQKIMEKKPTPIVVISANIESSELNITMNALKAGALSVVEKPVGLSSKDYEGIASKICTQLYIMSDIKVIKQRFRRKLEITKEIKTISPSETNYCETSQPFELLGVVTSTGGPPALIEFLGKLPPDFPLPIVLVQHITTSFLDGFIKWLQVNTPFKVVKVKQKTKMTKGHIYMAPEDSHLVVEPNIAYSNKSEPICSQRPSGTVLFESMARHYTKNSIGILLTGMGKDGAWGLKQLHNSGGFTIAEDASTAVVYGMPKEAVDLNAVCELIPLHQIGPRVLKLCRYGEINNDQK